MAPSCVPFQKSFGSFFHLGEVNRIIPRNKSYISYWLLLEITVFLTPSYLIWYVLLSDLCSFIKDVSLRVDSCKKVDKSLKRQGRRFLLNLHLLQFEGFPNSKRRTGGDDCWVYLPTVPHTFPSWSTSLQQERFSFRSGV